MKTTIAMLLSACCLAASAASYTLHCSQDEVDFWKELDKTALTVAQKDEVFAAYRAYNSASAHFAELMELNGLNKAKPVKKSIGADVRDPAIRQIEKIARQQHNRYEVLKKTITKYDPHKTNMTARVARQSMQSKLNAARAYEKQVKAIQKAARKDGKNLGKLRKDLEKYRDKAETVDFRDLCQGLLDMLPVPNDEN